jgi:hypothetical protein
LPPPVADGDRPAPDGAPAPLALRSARVDFADTLSVPTFDPIESFTIPDSDSGSGAPASDATPPVASAPAVSPERRTRGMAIAVALLAVLVAGAAWFVWETARDVVPGVRDTLAPAAPANTAPATPASPRS